MSPMQPPGRSRVTRKLFVSVFTVLAAAPIQINDTGIAAIAANPTGFYIVWSRQNKDYSGVVAGSRLNAAGAKLDGTNGVSNSGTKAPYAYDPIAVTWDGVNWRATWGDYTNLWVARINSSGTVLDAGSVKVPGPRPGLSAGNGTGGIQLVWTTYTNSKNDIYTAAAAANNTASINCCLSTGAQQQIKRTLPMAASLHTPGVFATAALPPWRARTIHLRQSGHIPRAPDRDNQCLPPAPIDEHP